MHLPSSMVFGLNIMPNNPTNYKGFSATAKKINWAVDAKLLWTVLTELAHPPSYQ